MGFTCHLCSLSCCAMKILLCSVDAVLAISGLMVKQVDIFKLLVQVGHISRIRAISIRAWPVGRRNQPVIRHNITLCICPISTCLNMIDLTDWYLIEIYHVTANVRKALFLSEKKSTTGDTMLKRNGLDRQATVFVNNSLLCGVNRMELNTILQTKAEHVHLCLEHRFKSCWCKNM